MKKVPIKFSTINAYQFIIAVALEASAFAHMQNNAVKILVSLKSPVTKTQAEN